MPYMEIQCSDCKIYYELGTSHDINTGNLLCVDCASTNVKILSYEADAHSRLSKIQADIKDLQDRIEIMSDDTTIIREIN